MGYESKIYFVKKTNLYYEDKRYAQIIAMIDLSKAGGIEKNFRITSDCYIYAESGNTMVTADRYGEELKEADINEVIEWVEKTPDRTQYARLDILLDMLKIFKKYGDITIIHYGY